ncbi:hypothetical protein VIN30_01065 [Adlercreutzia sp. R7]|uniref:Uncharacterized protein n=1 Tax=Adlercreutzia wanghongyangiae TaxID=3111451 RepID=A0ABU6IF56_9ACTN|nr:hypothetical protein [Adlercreutzia sp. R7]
MRALFLVVIISALVDFYLLQDAFAWMLGTASLTDLLTSHNGGRQTSDSAGAVFSALTCGALVVLYLVFGSVAGKKFSEFKAFRGGGSFAVAVILFIAMIIILVFIALVRYCSILDTIGNSSTVTDTFGGGFAGTAVGGGFGEGLGSLTDESDAGLSLDLRFSSLALVQTLGLVAVMFLGAILEVVHAYYSLDPYAAEKKRLAEAHVPEDRRLYESVYASYAVGPDKNIGREEHERNLDKRTVDAAFRICELSTQLNSIVDPADAYDFCSVSRMVRAGSINDHVQGGEDE